MSTNIRFQADRDIIGVATNQPTTQTVFFWTPTAVTQKLISSEDPVEAYIAWVLENFSIEQTYPVFADDDPFCEGEPVGSEIYNSGVEHVEEFRGWIAECVKNGYKIKAITW